MQRKDIAQLKEAAETNCRLYFDQLSTLKQQQEQVAVALEQERGKLRAYSELLDIWVDPKPAAKSPTPETQEEAPARPKASLIPVPPPSEPAKVKEK